MTRKAKTQANSNQTAPAPPKRGGRTKRVAEKASAARAVTVDNTIDANAMRWIPAENNGKILCIAFRPDGRHLVGGESSGYIRQWKVDSGEEFSPSPMKSSSDVYSVATSMDGRWIVSGDKGNKVIVWDAVTHQKAIEVSEHTHCVNAVDVSSDSTRMASGSQDCTVQVFDIQSGTRVIPPLWHADFVVGVKFSPDGSQIATATGQNYVHIYDACSGNKLSEITIPQLAVPPVTPLAWSSDGRRLFVGAIDKIISFDNTYTSYRLEWQHTSAISASIAVHGRFIACWAGNFTLFWDYSASRQLVGQTETFPSSDSLNCISISHDGRYLACGRDRGLQVRNLAGFLPPAYLNVPRISRIQLIQVSGAVLESWKRENPSDTESILSTEFAQHSSPNHHTLAARSLIRSRLREWGTAVEDAELSLKIKQSPIGQISRSLALIGAGKQEAALDDFDFVFHGAESNDNMLLLVIKSILMFMCGQRTQAISRLHRLITASNQDHYTLVLVNMYLKQGDYGNAVRTLELAKPFASQDSDPLTTISFIFNWDFDSLAATAWHAQCKSLYTSGCIKEFGETLEKMTSQLAHGKKEATRARILQELVTRTGEVTLLAWTGRSSMCNSCLPSSPTFYSDRPFVPPCLEGDELMKRTDELRSVIPLGDAMMIYGRVTRLQPVQFAHFRLLLPCIVFSVTSLEREQADVYRAGTIGLGDVRFATADSLPLKHPRRLVFADLRIHGLQKPHGATVSWDDTASSDAELVTDPAFTYAEIDHVPVIEEVPSASSDTYTQALELIAHLGQPFSALLLLQQPKGGYRRVAVDHEIVIRGMGNDVPKDIRVEVLEIL